MAISEQDVRHVAALARVGLDEARVPALVQQLNGILEHMDVLARVPMPVTAPDADATHGMPLRADGQPAQVLAHPRESFAPSMKDGFLLVPRLATHEAVDE